MNPELRAWESIAAVGMTNLFMNTTRCTSTLKITRSAFPTPKRFGASTRSGKWIIALKPALSYSRRYWRSWGVSWEPLQSRGSLFNRSLFNLGFPKCQNTLFPYGWRAKNQSDHYENRVKAGLNENLTSKEKNFQTEIQSSTIPLCIRMLCGIEPGCRSGRWNTGGMVWKQRLMVEKIIELPQEMATKVIFMDIEEIGAILGQLLPHELWLRYKFQFNSSIFSYF